MADSLADVRKRLAAKNAKLAAARTAKVVAEEKGSEELVLAHLLTEEARVDAELKAAVDAAKPANVADGYASSLDAAKAAMANYGGENVVELPEDGSTLEKPFGITPEGVVIGLDEPEPKPEPAPKTSGKAGN